MKHAAKRLRPIASGVAPSFERRGTLRDASFWPEARSRGAARRDALDFSGYVAVPPVFDFMLKAHAVVDVLALGRFTRLRVIAGGSATGIAISPWTLAFSMFVFFSIALAKRYVEVDRHGPSERRGYA